MSSSSNMNREQCKSILIVDDDTAILDVYQMMFLEMGYYPVLAFDPREAIEKALNLNPVLIIVDHVMPGMSGVEFIAELRKRGMVTPVVLVTASRNLEARAREAGSNFLIEKPFEVQELLDVVDRLVQGPRPFPRHGFQVLTA